MTKANDAAILKALKAIRAASQTRELSEEQRATIQSALDIAAKQAPLPAEVQAAALRLNFKVTK